MQMSDIDTAAFMLISDSSLYEKFKTLWLHNGNALSIQYAGTPSTTASLTMNGKEGIFGTINHGIASVSRFFISNFGDDFKQQCIDALLGRRAAKIVVAGPGVGEDGSVSVFVGSWNVARCVPAASVNLTKWLSGTAP